MDAKEKKKYGKSHCFRNCVIVTLVMLVVLAGAIFGGMTFAYNTYAEPILGIGMFDAFGIINNVGKYNENEILTNPYTQEDADAFYAGLENSACLDLPDDFSMSGAVNALIASQPQDGGTPNPEPTPTPMAEGDATIGSTLNDFTTGNAYLDDVLKRTKFDTSSLKGYENGGKDLSVTDKQFAAVISEVFNGLDVQSVKDIEAQLGVPLKRLLSIEQVTISNDVTIEKMLSNNETVLAEPAGDGTIIVDPLRKNVKISLVICAHLGENVSKVLTAKAPELPPFLGSMAAKLLPQKIFVGMSVFPYDSTRQPEIFINKVKGDIMTNLLKAVDGILKYSDPASTGVEALFSQMSGMITSTVSTIEDMVGKLNFVDSSLEMDPISAVMTVLKVNDPNAPVDPVTGKKPEYITGDNFFTMLKYIYNADNEIDGYDNATLEEKRQAYLSEVIAPEDRISKDDYVTNIDKLAMAYGIEKIESTDPNIAFDMSTWSPSDFVTNYQDIPSHINIVGARADGKYIYDIPEDVLLSETLVTDNAMGYMVNDIIATKVASGELSLPISVSVESFSLYEPTGLPGELRARFIGAVALSALLSDMNETAVLYGLLTSVLPKFMFLEIDIPMSANAGKGSIILNFVGRDGNVALAGGMTDAEREKGITLTKSAFDTLYRIVRALSPEMGEQIKLENLLQTLQGAVNDMLAQLNGTLGGEPSPAPMAGEGGATLKLPPIKLVAGGLQLPTIYDIVRTATNTLTLESEELRLALKDLYTYNEVLPESDTVLDAFIAEELEGKLFLINKEDPITHNKPINKANLFDSISTLGDRVKVEGVGALINARGLIDDTRANIDALKLSITDAQLAAIINTSNQLTNVGGGMPYVNLAMTEGTTIAEENGAFYMSFTMRGDFDATAMPPAPLGIKYEHLLPNQLYITARIRLTGTAEERYKTEIFINDNDNTNTPAEKNKTKSVLDAIIKGLIPQEAGKPEASFATIEGLIGENVAKALSSVEASGNAITFETGRIKAMSIYDVIYDYVVEPQLTPEDKAVLGASPAQSVMTIFKAVLGEVEVVPMPDGGTFDRLVKDEFETKMLLAPGTINVNSDNILGDISAMSAGDVFTKLAPKNVLKPELEDVANMDILIRESELCRIMRQEMSRYEIAGLPAMFEMLEGSPLVDFKIVDNGKIELVFGLHVRDIHTTDPEYGTYQNIIPFMPNNILVYATIDMASYKGVDGVITLKTTTSVTLNKLEELVHADPTYMAKTSVILKAMSSGFDIDAIENQVNAQITKMFSKMSDTGMEIAFEVGTGGAEGVMRSGCIYDIMRSADKVRFENITNEEIHSVMRGLQNTDMSGALLNPHVTPAPTGGNAPGIDIANRTVTLLDYYIAYGLFESGITDKNKGDTVIGHTNQMAILSGVGLLNAQAKYGAETLTHSRGIVLSIEVTDPSSYNSIGSSGISNILPEGLTVTVVFDIPDAVGNDIQTNDINISVFINNMTLDDMNVLNRLLGSGNDVAGTIAGAVKSSIFDANITVGTLGSINLGMVLCSKDTEYVDLSQSGTAGVYGALKYKVTL